MTDRSRFGTAVVLSVLIHFLILGVMRTAQQLHGISVPEPVVVDLVSLPPPRPRPRPAPVPKAPPQASAAEKPAAPALPEHQVVEPPDAGEEKRPEDTRLLSDRDVTVPEQRVRHGEGGKTGEKSVIAGEAQKPLAPAPLAKPAPQPAARPPRPAAEHPQAAEKAAADRHPAEAGEMASEPAAGRPQRLARLPSLDSLLPKAEELARQGRAGSQPPPPAAERDLLNTGNALAFAGRPGTRDFLPSVREGDITLLNTKASLFAPFVRRVAKRVFESLEIQFNYSIRQSGLQGGREAATVEAIMDKKGNLVSARLLRHDGGSGLSVDRALLNATRPDIFFDANPPQGAEADDGNIHFILMADIAVQVGNDARSAGLAYGYSGVAGVGLK